MEFRAADLSEYKLYSGAENWAFLRGTSLAKTLVFPGFLRKGSRITIRVSGFESLLRYVLSLPLRAGACEYQRDT